MEAIYSQIRAMAAVAADIKAMINEPCVLKDRL